MMSMVIGVWQNCLTISLAFPPPTKASWHREKEGRGCVFTLDRFEVKKKVNPGNSFCGVLAMKNLRSFLKTGFRNIYCSYFMGVDRIEVMFGALIKRNVKGAHSRLYFKPK